MFEVFEHTADLGLRIRSSTVEELFVDAARALTSLIVTDLDTIEAVAERSIRVEGPELDYLLFDWLTELLVAFETERLLFNDFSVTRTATGIEGRCRGEKLDPNRHQLEHEVKAITYHGLRVTGSDQGWTAEVIVDI